METIFPSTESLHDLIYSAIKGRHSIKIPEQEIRNFGLGVLLRRGKQGIETIQHQSSSPMPFPEKHKNGAENSVVQWRFALILLIDSKLTVRSGTKSIDC